jgi:alpha-glucosidase (family GH31 glycosyl hydrolase)
MADTCPIISFQAAGGTVQARACTPRAIRVRFFGPPVVAEASYVGREEWPPVSSPDATTEAVTEERISTGRLTLRVDASGSSANTPGFALFDGAGRRLLGTPPRGGIVRETVTDSESGEPRGRVTIQLQRSRTGYEDDVHFYGLGQGGGAQLDRIGTSRLFWNSQVGHGSGVDFGVPLVVASAPGGAYGLFFDTTAMARLDTARGSGGLTLRYEADVPSFDLYLLAGPRPADVLEAYCELTGFPALPPKWSLGFLQSTRFFENTGEILELAATMREKRLPCDALIFLSTYGNAQGWNRGVGHLGWQQALFPDPAATLGTLRDEHHLRFITHEYPVIHPDAPGYAEAERRGFLLDIAYPAPPPASASVPAASSGDGRDAAHSRQLYAENQRFLDFTNPECRAWWWAQHQEIVDLGVAGWWLDGGEGPSGPAPLHRGTPLLLHNAFDLYRFRAFADGEARDRPDGRAWMLCRSGAAGMQRLGAGTWSGDINTTFTTFEAQILLGLGLAMSGVPYFGTDIGGFYPNALDGELYARWFQFGAFAPIFRAHGWVWREHLPWAHGPEVEAICRRYGELRMRLLPYLYTAAWDAHTTGMPLMRPLAMEYPDDPNVWELGRQYLFGPDLLVAPVTRAGATHWPVYLPAGAWYDFWTGQKYEGGRAVSVETPLDTIPLFARGGAIIPMGPVMQRTDERPLDDLTLLVYPGAPAAGDGVWSGVGVLYEDDGATRAHQRGEYARTEIRSAFDDDAVLVEIDAAQGEYAGQPAARDITVRIWSQRQPSRVTVQRGGRADDTALWEHDGQTWLQVSVPQVDRRETVTVHVTF